MTARLCPYIPQLGIGASTVNHITGLRMTKSNGHLNGQERKSLLEEKTKSLTGVNILIENKANQYFLHSLKKRNLNKVELSTALILLFYSS